MSLMALSCRLSSTAAAVMFDCYRTQRMVRAGIVNYDGCFVDTTKGE